MISTVLTSSRFPAGRGPLQPIVRWSGNLGASRAANVYSVHNYMWQTEFAASYRRCVYE